MFIEHTSFDFWIHISDFLLIKINRLIHIGYSTGLAWEYALNRAGKRFNAPMKFQLKLTDYNCYINSQNLIPDQIIIFCTEETMNMKKIGFENK